MSYSKRDFSNDIMWLLAPVAIGICIGVVVYWTILA